MLMYSTAKLVIVKLNICSASLILVNSSYLHGNNALGAQSNIYYLFQIEFIATTCVIKTSQ